MFILFFIQAIAGTSHDADKDQSPPEKPSKSQKKKKQKVADDSSETTMMSQISTCMKDVSELVSDQKKTEDSHAVWGKLLVMKLREMDHKEAENIKFKVDVMCHEVLNG